MIERCHLFFLKIDRHLGNLLLCRHQFVSFPLLAHTENFHLSYVVVVVKIILSSVNALGLILYKGHTSTHYLIVSIFIILSCFLSNFFNSFDKTVVVTIRVVGNYSHPAVHLDHLLPVRQLSRPIILDCFKIKRISVSPLQLIASVFVKISQFFNPQLFVVLY